MSTEANMLKMFKVVHGEFSGSFSLVVKEPFDEEPWISVQKDDNECWIATKSDLLFDYVCKTQLNANKH